LAGVSRRSAPERREEIAGLAIEHFALDGFKGASTDRIAQDAGISQPYLFRLFGTKRGLFLACHEVVHGLIRDSFTAAARGVPKEERMGAMGRAYMALLADRTKLLFMMQSYAACSDAEIRAQVRGRYGELVAEVGEITGASAPELWRFFSTGMLLNVVTSLDLAEIAGEDAWAAQWSQPEALIKES
jgi:AcrR family transcriptional regulator